MLTPMNLQQLLIKLASNPALRNVLLWTMGNLRFEQAGMMLFALPSTRANPYKVYARFRDVHPVAMSQGMAMVARYEDVAATLRSPAIGQEPSPDGGGLSML